MRPETGVAIETVREGLTTAMTGAGAGDITTKAGRDVVTATDVAVEDLMRIWLTATFAYPVIGEERGGVAPADGSPYWLIDPICGTRNFASGVPLYCVNLALVEAGEVTVAAIGDASRDEVTYAEHGGGAWATRLGATTRLATSTDSRTLVVEEGKSSGEARNHAARFMSRVVAADRWDFRSLGSTIAMPYLAAGRISAYVVFFGGAIHCAAGSLLVSEAGGAVTDTSGAPWTIRSESLLLSANHTLHAELIGIASRSARE